MEENFDQIFVSPRATKVSNVGVTGAPYREVNSKVATAPKLKVEDRDKGNNSRRIKWLNLISLS